MSLTKKKWETYQNEKIFQFIRGVHSILLYNLSEVYSIQHHVIKFVSDLRQLGGFLPALRFPPPIKLIGNDKTEILLKVTINTITLT
jgi:hypothetical protein